MANDIGTVTFHYDNKVRQEVIGYDGTCSVRQKNGTVEQVPNPIYRWTFTCDTCKKVLSKEGQLFAPYGIMGKEPNITLSCHACCAEHDRKVMRDDGKHVLYLVSKKVEDGERVPYQTVFNGRTYEITNFPGSLRIPVRWCKTGSHNIGRTRTDVWFHFEDTEWHGVQIGENNQICRVHRLKKARIAGRIGCIATHQTGDR